MDEAKEAQWVALVTNVFKVGPLYWDWDMIFLKVSEIIFKKKSTLNLNLKKPKTFQILRVFCFVTF
jgi:hypothetical protein